MHSFMINLNTAGSFANVGLNCRLTLARNSNLFNQFPFNVLALEQPQFLPLSLDIINIFSMHSCHIEFSSYKICKQKDVAPNIVKIPTIWLF